MLVLEKLRRNHRIATEVAWVFAGQGVSALATLVGLRLITEWVPPAVYGNVVLALGVVTLAHGLAALPLMQAVLRFYPDFAAGGREAQLRQAARLALRKPLVLTLFVLAGLGVGAIALQPQQTWLVVFALALFVAEVARSVEITFLNAARRQRAMALLLAADAWLRPLAAVALVWVFGANSAVIMAGYLSGCALALAGFRLSLRSNRLGRDSIPARDSSIPVIADVSRRIRAYALPLTGLPLIEWISGQADRYLLGGITGSAAAGIYAALYGLASKPALMFSASVELALRQPYYGRLSAGDRTGERLVLAVWLATITIGTLILCVLFVLFHAKIAAVVLAAEYRAHSALMGWIAAGYVFLVNAWTLRSVCYAYHDTRGVVLVEAAGAALSVVIAAPLIWRYGIEGAAWALPVYFGAQLMLAATRARRAWRRGRKPLPMPTAAGTSACW